MRFPFFFAQRFFVWVPLLLLSCVVNVHAQPQPNGSNLLVVVDQPKNGAANNARVFSPETSASFTFYPSVSSYTLAATKPDSTFTGAFRAPGHANLTPGTYISPNIFANATEAGMYTDYDPRCNGYLLPGRKFVVHEVAYDGTGAITNLALDFVDVCSQYASSAARVFGYVRIQSQLPINYTIDAPAPFVFASVTGAAVSSWIVSNEVTISGINVPVAVNVVGGEYSINGGAFTAAPGTFVAGQRIRMRVMSGAQPNQLTQGTLTVGGESSVFKVGTATGDFPQPTGEPLIVLIKHPVSDTDPITTRILSPATGAEIGLKQDGYNNQQTSMTAALPDGYDTHAFFIGPDGNRLTVGYYPDATQYGSATKPHVVSNETVCANPDGNISLNVLEIEVDANGILTKLAVDYAARCVVSPNQSQSAFYGYIRYNTTLPIDYSITLPTPFAFASRGSQALNTLVESNEITLRGITVPVPITVVGGEYSVDGGAFTAATGSVTTGQRIRMRMLSPAQNNRTVTSSLTVGQRTASFTVGSVPDGAPQPNGDPLIVLLSQSAVTGAVTPTVLSPATNAVLGFPQTSYYYPNMFAVGGGIPGVYSSGSGWYAQLTAPNAQPLVAGSYENATFYGSETTAKFENYSEGCGTSYTARFVVHEIEYQAPLKPSKLAMDFVQLCSIDNAVVSAVIGFVRINSAWPIDYTIRQPVQFNFPIVTGADPGSRVETSEFTVRGVTVPVAVSATGGEYRIDDGPYVTTPGMVMDGQRIRFRVAASTLENAVTSGVLTVGEGAATFRVATRVGSNPQANGAPLAVFISQGFDQAGLGRTWFLSPATLSQFTLTHNSRGGVSLIIKTPTPGLSNSYDFWTTEFEAPNNVPLVPGSYANAIRFSLGNPPVMQPGMFAGATSCYGALTGSFTVHEIAHSATGVDVLALDFVQYCNNSNDPLYGYIRVNSNVPISQVEDTRPSFFYFDPLNGVARNQMQVSNEIVPRNFNSAAQISIVNGEYSIDNSPFTATAGTIAPGQTLRVRLMSSPLLATATVATLNIGGTTGDFYVMTEQVDVNPDSFSFAVVTAAPLGQWVLSEVRVPTGYNAPADVSIYGYGGEFSIAGRPFTSAQGTINPGESIQLRIFTPIENGYIAESYVRVGDYNGGVGYFKVRTLRSYTLTTSVNGGGRVLVAPAGTQCLTSCSVAIDENTVVTLMPQPDPGQRFAGWNGGGCTGTGPCTITLVSSQNIQANFAPAPPAAPTITSVIPGDGLAIFSFTLVPRATLYQAECTPGNDSVTSTTSPIVFTPMSNGVPHTCTVTALNQYGGTASAPATVTPNAAVALALQAVSSRKLHGDDQVFDLALPASSSVGGPTVIEPRMGSAPGHLLAFTFNRDVASVGAASVVDGNGISLGAAMVARVNNRVELTLPALPDGTKVTVTLTGVNGTLDVGTTVGFLRGDVDGSGTVNADDLRAIKARAGHAVDGTTFKFDINLSETISAADIATVKARNGALLR